MNIESAVRDARRAAEAIMTTTVKVSSGGGQVFDDATGEWVDTPPTIHYQGKARIKQHGSAVEQAEAPGYIVAIQQLILSVPVTGTGAITDGHEVEVLADPLDDDLVGTKFTITGDSAQSHASARRFTIERKTT